MSGIDECGYEDIPICPRCGERPAFWILKITNDNWFWLYSYEYFMKNGESNRLQQCFFGTQKYTPDDVVSIKCRAKGIYTSSHIFDSQDGVFENVIYLAKYIQRNVG